MNGALFADYTPFINSSDKKVVFGTSMVLYVLVVTMVSIASFGNVDIETMKQYNDLM